MRKEGRGLGAHHRVGREPVRDLPRRRAQPAQSVERGRDADAPSDVGPDAEDRTLQAQEGALAAAGPTGRQCAVERVERPTEDVVPGVGDLRAPQRQRSAGEGRRETRGLAIIVCGTFVRQCSTAPASMSMLTSAQSRFEIRSR